jgi:hypothetical protein
MDQSYQNDRNFVELVVVIPTRDRPDLALNAIRSVLSQPLDRIRLIVSDNSTNEDHITALARVCEELSDSRLLYIKPPKPLSMTEHWDWAMHQSLRLFNASHFIYLTDRSIFKPHALVNIMEIARLNPNKVVSYDWITIFDHEYPIEIEEKSQTGQLVEVLASRLLLLSSQSIFPHCLPRMMTSCVPRMVIEAMSKRFGNVFASMSPDYNFCYRCLAVVDSILYYDVAAFISYAIQKSTGAAAHGLSTEAANDFAASLSIGPLPKSFAAPIPDFETGTNYVLHEYCLVQHQVGFQKFPEVDRTKYLNSIAAEVAHNQNPPLKHQMQGLLQTIGYKTPLAKRMARLYARLSLRTRLRKILRLQWPTIPLPARPRFDALQDAIDYAISAEPKDNLRAVHLDLLRD